MNGRYKQLNSVTLSNIAGLDSLKLGVRILQVKFFLDLGLWISEPLKDHDL